MEDIKTELGKIYCIFNEYKDKFDKFRVSDVYKDDNGDMRYEISDINDNYHFSEEITTARLYNIDEYKEFANKHILLKSEGIVSLTNVVSFRNEQFNLKDVILIYFPNNKITKVPSIKEPFAVARQGVDNIFAAMAGLSDIAGISVTTETVPAGYALSDFLESEEAISSHLCHIYKTDRIDELYELLDSNITSDILSDMYEHRVTYLKNTMADADKYIEIHKKWLDGYCNNLKDFMNESGFFDDIMLRIGIRAIDFKLEENKPIDEPNKLVLSILYGGISICKAVPMKFDYEINLSAIKMPYFLILDSDKDLYIVPYTKNSDEFDGKAFYESVVDNDNKLQERLQRIAKAYDVHKNDEPTLKF